MPFLSFSSPFLSKIELLKPSKVKNKKYFFMGKKICRVFLDFRSEPELERDPEPYFQNQTAPKHCSK